MTRSTDINAGQTGTRSVQNKLPSNYGNIVSPTPTPTKKHSRDNAREDTGVFDIEKHLT